MTSNARVVGVCIPPFRLVFSIFALAAVARAQSSISTADIRSTLKGRLSTTVRQSPCVRLMTVGASVGCGSSRGGAVGFLFPVLSQADLDAFTALPGDVPRVAVLSPTLLTTSNLDTLVGTSQFVGAVVLSGPSPPAGASDDAILLPSGASTQWPWNPLGRGLIQRRFPFPMVSLADAAESARVLGLAQSNTGAPRGAAQASPQQAMRLSFFMGEAGDALCVGACQVGVGGAQ